MKYFNLQHHIVNTNNNLKFIHQYQPQNSTGRKFSTIIKEHKKDNEKFHTLSITVII